MKSSTILAIVVAFVLGLLTSRLGHKDGLEGAPHGQVKPNGTFVGIPDQAGATAITGTNPDRGTRPPDRTVAAIDTHVEMKAVQAMTPLRQHLLAVIEELGDVWILRHLHSDVAQAGDSEVERVILKTLLSSENPDLIEVCGKILVGEQLMSDGYVTNEFTSRNIPERGQQDKSDLWSQVLQEVSNGTNRNRQYWLAPLIGQAWADPKAFPTLRLLLESGDPELQVRTLQRLWMSFPSSEQTPGDSTPHVTELMSVLAKLARNGSSSQVRSRALSVVTSPQVPLEWWQLVSTAMLRDPSSEVRMAAISGLAIATNPSDSLHNLAIITRDDRRTVTERRAAAERILVFLRPEQNELWRGVLTSGEMENIRGLCGPK